MRKIKNLLFSMELTGLLLLLFAIAAAVATFIENDFGTIAAKAKVYNAKWFEFMLLLLAINMTGSIFKHKMYMRSKWTILLFHVAFLIIFIGAAITRYISYEGMMSIREGELSNEIVSDETYIRVWAEDGNSTYYTEDRILPTPASAGKFSDHFSIGGKSVSIEVVEYFSNAGETIIEGEGGPMLWLVLSDEQSGRQDYYFEPGDLKKLGSYQIGLNAENATNFIDIRLAEGGNMTIQSPDSISFMSMMAGVNKMLSPDTVHPFQPMALYRIGDVSIVVSNFMTKPGRVW
ncbi:MAG: cytochrome c biogenesis protein ResB [Bacteroidales bacterium]